MIIHSYSSPHHPHPKKNLHARFLHHNIRLCVLQDIATWLSNRHILCDNYQKWQHAWLNKTAEQIKADFPWYRELSQMPQSCTRAHHQTHAERLTNHLRLCIVKVMKFIRAVINRHFCSCSLIFPASILVHLISHASRYGIRISLNHIEHVIPNYYYW